MDVRSEDIPAAPSSVWGKRWQRVRVKLIAALPFTGGVLATLLALLLYRALIPQPQALTMNDVNGAVAHALASATPRPAYSEQVYQAIQPSLVFIQAKLQDANGKPESGLGSGVVISDQGDILTAYHVVKDASQIQIIFADGTKTSAQIASKQPENDIAVLQPENLPKVLVPAVLGNPRAVQIGDEAYAVGNPFGLYGSMSAGIISGFDRSFDAEGSNQKIQGLIQFDAAVNPGNSGGPLLNRNGQVIGIVVGILNPTSERVFIGIGFAVPITTAGGAAGLPQY